MYGLFTVATFTIEKISPSMDPVNIPFERGPMGKSSGMAIVTAPPTVPTTKVMAQR